MFRKTLIAMAVAAVLGCPVGAFAASGSDHSAYRNDEAVPTAQSVRESSLPLHTASVSTPVEIGDGHRASIADESFDGPAVTEDDSVGATASADGADMAAGAGEGGLQRSAHASKSGALVDEVYLVPAPLASTDGSRYWKVELSPSRLEEFKRLHTENVYVMMPIEDAIIDPRIALTSNADGIIAALAEAQHVESIG